MMGRASAYAALAQQIDRPGSSNQPITDVNMPGHMDGLTLAARVAERWPHIRLVLTSGRCGLSDHEVPDHGQFVQKPYRQSDLMQAITHVA